MVPALRLFLAGIELELYFSDISKLCAAHSERFFCGEKSKWEISIWLGWSQKNVFVFDGEPASFLNESLLQRVQCSVFVQNKPHYYTQHKSEENHQRPTSSICMRFGFVGGGGSSRRCSSKLRIITLYWVNGRSDLISVTTLTTSLPQRPQEKKRKNDEGSEQPNPCLVVSLIRTHRKKLKTEFSLVECWYSAFAKVFFLSWLYAVVWYNIVKSKSTTTNLLYSADDPMPANPISLLRTYLKSPANETKQPHLISLLLYYLLLAYYIWTQRKRAIICTLHHH